MTTSLKRFIDDTFCLVSSKFLKLDESLRKDLENVQIDLIGIKEKRREEQIELKRKYNAITNEHFHSRAELVKKIPHFWKEVLLNFGSPAGLIHEDEFEVLDHLVDVKLEDNLDKRGSHKFTFTFSENPFFKETIIVKQIKIQVDAVIVDVTPITFLKNPIEGLDERIRHHTFLGWLQSKEEEGENELNDFGTIFREDVWDNALRIYVGEHDEDDEDDEREDDEDDEASTTEGDEESEEEGEEGEGGGEKK